MTRSGGSNARWDLADGLGGGARVRGREVQAAAGGHGSMTMMSCLACAASIDRGREEASESGALGWLSSVLLMLYEGRGLAAAGFT